MSKNLLIYCEGQTEEMIVERLLRNHLKHFGVHVERPELAATSFDPSGQRGGFVNWDAIEFDLKQIFSENNNPNRRFTTFLDVYAMPKKVFQMAGFASPVSSSEEIDLIQNFIEEFFGENRFKAYLQRHELEALLLANTGALKTVFHRDIAGIESLENDIQNIENVEDINHGPTTHPSARLAKAIIGYDDLKASNAYFVLAEAGIDSIRQKCPRFNNWLSYWENWGME